MGLGLIAIPSKTHKDVIIYKILITGKRAVGKSGLAEEYKLQGTNYLEM